MDITGKRWLNNGAMSPRVHTCSSTAGIGARVRAALRNGALRPEVVVDKGAEEGLRGGGEMPRYR